jgi:hypothetical protein
MLINHKKKFIYIHSPKTAGTTIHSLFDPSNKWFIRPKHMKAQECFQYVGKKKFEKYIKFSFVRNPWERQVSLYEWINMKRKQQNKPILKNFKTFIRSHKEMPAQINWLTLNGICIMDFVGRVEKFDEDIKLIAEMLKIKIKKIPKYNATSHKPYQEYYDDESMELVKSRIQPDVDVFGYQFN